MLLNHLTTTNHCLSLSNKRSKAISSTGGRMTKIGRLKQRINLKYLMNCHRMFNCNSLGITYIVVFIISLGIYLHFLYKIQEKKIVSLMLLIDLIGAL